MAIREIIFDTETTGFDPNSGDRIVEIGAVELIDYLPTGKEFHSFINPERDIPTESTRIHGITNETVKDSPRFSEICGNFLDFIGNDFLVAHNARFDMNFLNFQLKELGFPAIGDERVKDSLSLAKSKYPGQMNSLDALCRRFNIDLAVRSDRHGALLDSYLLADVWLELHGGRQQSMLLGEQKNQAEAQLNQSQKAEDILKPRDFPISAEELKNHRVFLDKYIKDSLWNK
ncbi:MAG: DNA polymerase III subunit epsilon [Alphaproteobacteria bacterium]